MNTPTLLTHRKRLPRWMVNNRQCVEIGVARGEYSRALLAYKPTSLTLIDVWRHIDPDYTDGFKYVDGCNKPNNLRENDYKSVQRIFGVLPNVKVMRCFSSEAVKNFSEASIDFVYIDANHAFDAAYNDLKIWYTIIRPGGWLCGHDYADECTDTNICQVKSAVDKFIAERNLSIQYLTDEPRPSFFIRKP